MTVTGEIKGTKLILKLDKGSQTVSNCSQSANDEALYALGASVAALQKEAVATISKVVETTLIAE